MKSGLRPTWLERLGLGLTVAAIVGLSHAAQLSGQVVQIVDGDTLILLLDCASLEVPIRLAAIDAPERGMPQAEAATESLRDLTWGKTALVHWHKRDKYGRLVGKVVVGGLDVNLEQVKRGLAWHFQAYAHEQSAEDRLAYAEAQALASSQRRGLWQDQHPQPPWQWRRQARAAATGEARQGASAPSAAPDPLRADDAEARDSAALTPP